MSLFRSSSTYCQNKSDSLIMTISGYKNKYGFILFEILLKLFSGSSWNYCLVA